jgi:hypothetical protein
VASEHCIVVDTNVIKIADGLHGEASDDCRLACVRVVRLLEAGQRVCVDTADGILAEYVRAFAGADVSGLGARVVTRLWRVRSDGRVCHQVEITPSETIPGSFDEVPVPLRTFDMDDQKFIAVAVAEGSQPCIFEGLDEEWWVRRREFSAAGIDVQFVCAPDLMEGDSS